MIKVPFTYRAAVWVARTGAPLVARPGSKLSRGLEGRRSAGADLVRWGARERDADRPTAWFHAPSVGEALQAQAVMRVLAERMPGLQLVFTHFSPSAEGIAGRMEVDAATYLPWDQERVVGEVLDAVDPDLVVFTKTELWPVLAKEAARRGARLALIAGSVASDAGRRRWLVRSLLRSAWAGLDVACATSEQDARGLRTLGVEERALSVTGDPAVDAALARLAAIEPDASCLTPFSADRRPTVVCGSTWPSCDRVLVPALTSVRVRVPRVRIVLAPHEPRPDRVRELVARLEREGWTVATLGQVERATSLGGANAVVVDRVGALAALYTIGSVAYVGGGFHRAGLHSVLEPAAAGCPVVFGPRHGRSRAAADLIAAGAARAVERTEELATVVSEWLLDPETCEYSGGRAFDYIDARRGSAARTADRLQPLLQPLPGE